MLFQDWITKSGHMQFAFLVEVGIPDGFLRRLEQKKTKIGAQHLQITHY